MARMGRLGWFLGLVVGTVFGVLFAPRKGKELRQKMKDDRSKGKLGIAPLKSDFRELGEELVGLARDLYQSEMLQDIIVKGRKKMKDLSDDFVEEVSDFHTTKIEPFTEKMKQQLDTWEEGMKMGEKKAKAVRRKVKESVKSVKRVLKKKPE